MVKTGRIKNKTNISTLINCFATKKGQETSKKQIRKADISYALPSRPPPFPHNLLHPPVPFNGTSDQVTKTLLGSLWMLVYVHTILSIGKVQRV